MKKSRAWCIRFPGSFYALGPLRFREPVSENAARRYAREHITMSERLPSGTELWPTND